MHLYPATISKIENLSSHVVGVSTRTGAHVKMSCPCLPLCARLLNPPIEATFIWDDVKYQTNLSHVEEVVNKVFKNIHTSVKVSALEEHVLPLRQN